MGLHSACIAQFSLCEPSSEPKQNLQSHHICLSVRLDMYVGLQIRFLAQIASMWLDLFWFKCSTDYINWRGTRPPAGWLICTLAYLFSFALTNSTWPAHFAFVAFVNVFPKFSPLFSVLSAWFNSRAPSDLDTFFVCVCTFQPF